MNPTRVNSRGAVLVDLHLFIKTVRPQQNEV